MKKMRLAFAAIFTAVAIVLSSCGGINKMKDNSANVKYTVTPNPLEMKAGKVSVTVEVKYPEKFFNKKATLTLKPFLKYATGQTDLPVKVLQGESVQANNEVIKNATGGTVTYSATFDYKPEMLSSELMVGATIALGEKKSIDIPAVKIADGVLATPSLVQNNPKVTLLADKFERIKADKVAAKINYDIQSSNIKKTELTQDDVKKLEEFIKSLKANDKVVFKGIAIDAYASPDGTEKLNEKVSSGRKSTSVDYMTKTVKKAGIKDTSADVKKYNVKTTTEDWDGFKSLVEQSTIQDKELILRVLSMYSDPEVREKELKNMSVAFESLAKEILPQLRRSELMVNIDKIGYSDEELLQLAQSTPEKLDVEEILHAAVLAPDFSAKLAIYQKASELFPQDARAINNVGWAQFNLGKVDEAKAAFEKAKSINANDPAINSNIGACELKQGNIDKAEEILTASLGAGDAANYNLGIIKIMKGDYDQAVASLANSCENNAGLASLLKGNNDEALKALECVKEPDALTFYLRALVGARTQNESLMTSNLRSAVGKDALYKDYAKKDLEFRNYFKNEAFMSIVQ